MALEATSHGEKLHNAKLIGGRIDLFVLLRMFNNNNMDVYYFFNRLNRGIPIKHQFNI